MIAELQYLMEDAPDENDTGQDGGTRDGSGSNEEQGEDGNREE